MSSLTGNQNGGFVDGSTGVTTFSLGTANLGTLVAATRLRMVAQFSVLTKGATLSTVVTVTDSEGLTWHRAAAVDTHSPGITQPTGMTGNPLTQDLEIWYTDNFVSTDIVAPTVYQLTITTTNDVDSVVIYYACHRRIDAAVPLDANVSNPSADSVMSSSTSNSSVTMSSNTANIQVMVAFSAVGPGQRPGGGGQPSVDGVTSSDYGVNDTFHLNQNFHIYGNGTYDRTSPLSSASIFTHDATNNQLFLAVVFTEDSAAITGNFNVTEAQDVFHSATGYIGTMAATEFADNLFMYGIVPPSGTLVATDPQDSWATSPGFETLAIENAASTFGAGNFNFTTNGPNRIIVMAFGTSSVGTQVLQPVQSVTGAGLTFQRSDMMQAGQDSDSDNFLCEFWWAFAPHKVINEVFTVTYETGLSSTQLSAVFAIKGLNGHYGDPFDRVNPFSWGSNSGSMLSGTSNPTAQRALATGPLSTGGAASDFATLDAGNSSHVILSGSPRLTVTSDQTNSPDNWGAPALAAALESDMRYFETEFNVIHGSKYGVGLLVDPNGDFTPHQLVTDGTGGIMMRGDGTIWANGAQVASLGVTPANGDIIQVFVNLSNHYAWFRDLTQASNWNGNPRAVPGEAGDRFSAGGLPFVGRLSSTPITSDAPPHIAFGGLVLPYLFVDGTATSPAASQTANFGGSAFAGTPPNGSLGWYFPSPAVPPTRARFPSIVLGMQFSVRGGAVAALGAPTGYTQLVNFDHQGSQRHGTLELYAKINTGNVLQADNDFQTGPNPVEHWAMMYTTFVGSGAPGSFDVLEAQDQAYFVGHLFPGVRGDLTAFGTSDTFAALGYTADTGTMFLRESADIFSAFGFQPITGTFNTTETPDRFAATGVGRGEDGIFVTTETPDIFAAIGAVPPQGIWASTEAADVFRAIGAGVTQVTRRRRRFVT